MGFGLTGSGWKYAAASVIGTSHLKHTGGICQDAHRARYLATQDAFVAVVCDGAGSASQSQTGADTVSEYVLTQLSVAEPDDLFQESFALQVLAGARAMLQNLADGAHTAIREFACTLLVSIVGPELAVFWQVGDGAICFRKAEEEKFNYVFWPEKGDYANVTFFVTDSNVQQQFEFDAIGGHVVEVALFSDGLERLALDFVSGEAHTGFFNGLFPHIRMLPVGYSAAVSAEIAGFLESERVNRRTDDDKTLVLASRAI